MSEFDTDDMGETRGRSVAGGVATVALAAAVGAGVALLFTTDAGERTRKRVRSRVRDLGLRDRAERLGEAALDGWEEVRDRGVRHLQSAVSSRDDRSALYATIGTVAGAALAALLTPQGGRETREWLGNTFDDLRQNASLRWKEHRARRQREAPETESAIRRMAENGHGMGGEMEEPEGRTE